MTHTKEIHSICSLCFLTTRKPEDPIDFLREMCNSTPENRTFRQNKKIHRIGWDSGKMQLATHVCHHSYFLRDDALLIVPSSLSPLLQIVCANEADFPWQKHPLSIRTDRDRSDTLGAGIAAKA